MKLSTTAKTLSIVAVFALTLTAASTAQASDKACSNATLRGAYSDQDTGTIVGLGPFAGVNVDRFDGNGDMTINGYSSVNGSVSPSAETGTYQVKPDCTGTYTVSDAYGDTFNAFFVVSDDGDQLRIVITNPDTVINCIARKQFPEHHD